MRIISNGKEDPGTVISEKKDESTDNNLPDVSEHKEEPQIFIPMELIIKRLDELSLRLNVIVGLGPQYEIMELKRKLAIVEGLVKDKHNVIETLLLGGLKATYELNKLRDEMKTIRARAELGGIKIDNSIVPPMNEELDGTIITPSNIASSKKCASHTKKCERCGVEKHYRAFTKNVNICRECCKMIANKVKNEQVLLNEYGGEI